MKHSEATLMLLGIVGTGTDSGEEADPIGDALRADAVAYWKLGDTTDSTGRGNTLTNGNVVTFVAGKVGNAASFVAASEQRLYIASNADVSIGAGSLAMAFWFQVGSLAFDQPIIWKEESGDFLYEYIFYVATGSNLPVFIVSSNSVTASTFGETTVNTWLFVYLDYNVTNDTMRISVNNGALDGSLVGDVIPVGQELEIGAGTPDGVYSTSKIDEIGVWKRILTADERAYLYNSGTGRTLYE